jgi:hypothetical protein
MHGDRHLAYLNDERFPFSGNFFGITPTHAADALVLLAILNSTWTALTLEVLGRRGLGGGALTMVKTDLERMPILNPAAISASDCELLERALKALSLRPIGNLQSEVRKQDRRNLDQVVFANLGADAVRRTRVEEALLSMLSARASKATSLARQPGRR